MNIQPVTPATITPGQTVTRQIVVDGVVQDSPSTVEIAVSVSAAGNGTVSAPVSVTIDPEDATPTATVDVPVDSGLTASLGSFAEYIQGGGVSQWRATLTISAV